MTSRVALLLCLLGCASDPPKTDTPSSGNLPPDKTEVKMEAVPVTSSVPDPTPSASTSATATTTAAPTGDPSDDPNIGGPQADPAVEKAVASIRPRIRACFKKALIAQPAMTGSVTYDTTIGKDGKVSSARFVKKDGNLSDDLINCLTVTAKTMQFTPDRKSQIVAFSFGH